MSTAEIVKMLKGAKELLVTKGWTKEEYEDSNGRYCIIGACVKAVDGETLLETQSPDESVVEALGFESDGDAFLWNDCTSRTLEDVLARIDYSIAIAEGRV